MCVGKKIITFLFVGLSPMGFLEQGWTRVYRVDARTV